MKRRRLWLVAAALSSSDVAAASELSWSGPAECRQSEQLAFQVERALGAPLAQVGQVHLQVHVERLAPDARAVLRIADTSGLAAARVKERLLTAPDCTTLVDTLAVAIALAVEAAEPEPSPPAVSVQVAPAVAASEPPVTRDVVRSEAPTAAPAERLVPRVSALLLADLGSLPGPALGFGFGTGVGGARWQLELAGTLWLEQQPSLAGPAGAELSLATGGLQACALPWSAAPSSFALCASLEAGRLAGEGTGVSSPRQAAAWWVAPGLHGALSWQVPDTALRLVARVGAVLPLERRELVLENVGTVYQPASLAARAALGLDLALD